MSTTLTRPGSRLRRSLAGALTTALAASSIALLPSSAQADPDPVAAPSLSWKISDTATTALATRTFSGGASQDGNSVINFPQGTGYFDSGNGAASIAYQGSADLSFVSDGVTQYTVSIAEPVVSVSAAGEGSVTAVVSGSNAGQGGGAGASTTPARVVVATFDVEDDDWNVADGLAGVTVTPDWLSNVVPGSTEAANLGIAGSVLPWSGKSFNYGFMQQITPGVRARFYASGATEDTAGNNAKKPADITFSAALPETVATINSATPGGGLALGITGSGFTKETNPGDAGVYVGVAESGELPDVSSQSAMASFAAAVPVWSAAIGTDGSFATALTVPVDKLDPTKDYSVYTWRAHNHSTTSQDTETPLDIDYAAFTKYASTTSVSAPAGTYGKTGTISVTVPTLNGVAATGTVTLSGAVAQAAALVNGTATFAVPATLAAGSTALTASYSGDANYNASSSASTLNIAKANVKATVKVTKRPTSKKKGKATVTVKSTTSGTPTGKVTVTFKKKGKSTKTVTKTLSSGKGKINIPKLAKGTWKITVKYNGSTNFNKTGTTSAGTVKVKK